MAQQEQAAFTWSLPEHKDPPIADGDLREVKLPVKVVFEWSDKIISDFDYETGRVVEYTSGYIMRVVPDQSFVYKNEESIYLGSTVKEQ